MPIIFSVHPRTRKKIEEKNIKFNKLVKFMKPLGFIDYNKLQKDAFCVISDSGTITEESSIMNFPAITLRQAHERPEGMDEGTLIMSDLNYEDINLSIKVITNQNKKMHIVNDYDVNDVSTKVVRIILSYTKYINRTVWKNY
jgi:UDP-N-acetylglucosamine 2-epimerase (non-hydrolysing)